MNAAIANICCCVSFVFGADDCTAVDDDTSGGVLYVEIWDDDDDADGDESEEEEEEDGEGDAITALSDVEVDVVE